MTYNTDNVTRMGNIYCKKETFLYGLKKKAFQQLSEPPHHQYDRQTPILCVCVCARTRAVIFVRLVKWNCF